MAQRRWGLSGDSRRGGQYDLYRMRPDGSEVERLTETPENELPFDVLVEPERAKR